MIRIGTEDLHDERTLKFFIEHKHVERFLRAVGDGIGRKKFGIQHRVWRHLFDELTILRCIGHSRHWRKRTIGFAIVDEGKGHG